MTDNDRVPPDSPPTALEDAPLLLCDRTGETVYASPGAAALVGVERTDSPVPVERLVHPPDVEAVAAAFLDALETGVESRAVFRRRPSPRDRPLVATLVPLPGSREAPAGGPRTATVPPGTDAAAHLERDAAVLVNLRETTAADRLGRVIEVLGDPREGLVTADSRAAVVRRVLERTRWVDDLTLRFYLRDDATATLTAVPRDPATPDGVPVAVRVADRTGRVTALDDAAREELTRDGPPPSRGRPPAAAVAFPLGDHGVLVVVDRSADVSPALSRGLPYLAAAITLSLDRLAVRRRAARSAADLERLEAETGRFAAVVRAVRGAVRRVVEAASTGEVHRAVCTELAGLDPVALVRCGSFDPKSGVVVPEASAGSDPASFDRDGTGVDGWGSTPPVVEAARSGEPVSVPDVTAGSRTEGWRRATLSDGYRSVLAVPIPHGETVRGVVGVYGREAGGFEEPLRDGLVHLTRVMGHALAALEDRAALAATTIELVLSVPGEASPLARLAAVVGCPIQAKDATETPDGRTRMYVTADAPPEAVARAVERVAGLGAFTPLGERGEDTTYGVVVSGRTVPATVASLGAVLVGARTDGESVRTTVALPRRADADGFVEAVRRVHPGTELLDRRPRDRPADVASGFRSEVERRLTGRQREVLGAAYFGGYFEWPRGLNGSEVAATLAISQPTFARHLRAAQRTLLSLMFEDDT